jgi:signal transduction histidine kinase
LHERNEQLQRLAVEMSAAEQRERQRIAAVLHDTLQQLLIAARYKLAGSNKLEEADHLIDEAISVARSLTVELSPPVLHEHGLQAALDWLARQFHSRYGLTVILEAETGAEPRDPNVRAFLFQSVRELLLNVVKHAGTSQVQISLRRDPDGFIRLAVEDQGKGYDPVALPSKDDTGFGLFSIQKRLQLLGGSFQVKTLPGHGCHVSLTIPVDDASGGVAFAVPVSETEPLA